MVSEFYWLRAIGMLAIAVFGIWKSRHGGLSDGWAAAVHSPSSRVSPYKLEKDSRFLRQSFYLYESIKPDVQSVRAS